MQLINIVLADSQHLVRAGFRYLLQEEENFNIIGEAATPGQLLKIAQESKPDIVVFDYHNSATFSIKDVCSVAKITPNTRVLIVTADDDKKNIFSILECGVNSILTKNCSKEEIINAIKATAKSEKFFCNKVLDIILEKHLGNEEKESNCLPSSLTAREIEVVNLVAQGLPTKEIAERLCLSTHTIYTHRKNIMKKLQINSVSEMILYAINSGISKQELN